MEVQKFQAALNPRELTSREAGYSDPRERRRNFLFALTLRNLLPGLDEGTRTKTRDLPGEKIMNELIRF